MNIPEEESITSHSINHTRHGEEGAQQAHSQPSDRSNGDNEFGSIEPMGCKHLHQGGFGINLVVWDHQSENNAHLLEGGKRQSLVRRGVVLVMDG